ncbi:MAG TPA: OB-fold domain-containing protein [Acidimicrobiales bacterium]|nr:OB-fold domain-containing protein [Acidimicrobiales bacterium]
MTSAKTRVPAVDGWFTLDDAAPALLGSKCTSCGTFAFPKETFFCRNPECQSTEFSETELSRTGTVWSYTDACYQPPKPYVAADPYHPFSIAAVELAAEQMVVMGQVVAGVTVDDLAVGTEVEIVLDTLYEDDENEYVVWKWRPTSPPPTSDGATGSQGASNG